MTDEERKALKERFDEECSVVDMATEYGKDYVGNEKNIIVTELSREELYAKYGLVIAEYEPFAITNTKFDTIRNEYKKNEEKHRKRMIRSADAFGYDDELAPIFHPELRCWDVLCFEKEEQVKKEEIRRKQKDAMAEGLLKLSEIQRRRVIAYYYDKKTRSLIAEEEGVNHSAVDKSLAYAIKKLEKFIQKRVGNFDSQSE